MKPGQVETLTPGTPVRITAPGLYGVDRTGALTTVPEGAEGVYVGVWFLSGDDVWLRVSVQRDGEAWDVPVQAQMIEALAHAREAAS